MKKINIVCVQFLFAACCLGSTIKTTATCSISTLAGRQTITSATGSCDISTGSPDYYVDHVSDVAYVRPTGPECLIEADVNFYFGARTYGPFDMQAFGQSTVTADFSTAGPLRPGYIGWAAVAGSSSFGVLFPSTTTLLAGAFHVIPVMLGDGATGVSVGLDTMANGYVACDPVGGCENSSVLQGVTQGIFIGAFEADGKTIVPVFESLATTTPEPATWMLLALGIIALQKRQRAARPRN